MTSAFAGDRPGFGWLNVEFISSDAQDSQFNNYGGQERFWLGPEGGQFGLWFEQGAPFDTTHWRTPASLNSGSMALAAREPASVTLTRRFDVTNYSGTRFDCAVERTITALTARQVAENLDAPQVADLTMVAFESANRLTNVGAQTWTREGGLVSIWTLGQFKPLPRGKVIVPVNPGSDAELGPKATTDYFGPLSPERCAMAEDHLLFTCDGKYRSKIGTSAARSKDVCGSYDPDADVLTIVQFKLPDNAPQLPYVNSLWEIQDDPYAGDVINSYNDGEEIAGAGQLGPFHEIETSSPAADLGPGESIDHFQRTCHFAGDHGKIRDLASRVLGVDVDKIS